MARKTRAELEVLHRDLLEQIELFTMEVQYEKVLTDFRATYESWYAKRITLEECLNNMVDSMELCRNIGVWS